MAKECAMPLNYLKGEFQLTFPPNQGDPKGQGAQQTQPKKPHHSEISKRMLSQSRPNGLPRWNGK